MTAIFSPRRGDRRGVATGAGALSDDLARRLADLGFDAQQWLHPTRSDWQSTRRAGERAS
jgi:hypothetical protein